MKSHVGTFSCYYCGESMGVLLDKRLRNTLPMDCGAIDMEPCDSCKEWMSKGILLIAVKDGEMEKQEPEREKALAEYERQRKGDYWKKKHPFHWMPNPYRTGGWAVVTEDAFKNIFNGDIVSQVLACRWAFVPDEAWDSVGLPREETDELQDS